MKKQNQAKNMGVVIVMVTAPKGLLSLWLQTFLTTDYASGMISRYRSAIESFLTWYEQAEDHLSILDLLTPITLVGYRNFLQRTLARATSTVNGHTSVLPAWLTEQRHLEISLAKCIKPVGRQEPLSCEGLSNTEVNVLLRQSQSSSQGAVRKYGIVQLLLQTGMKLDECSHLNLEDIDLGERSGCVTVRHGKGYQARMVSLSISARQAFAEYLTPRLGYDPSTKAVAAIWPNANAKPAPSRWCSQKGRRFTASVMRQMLDIVVRDAAARGLVSVSESAHTLWHAFARNYLAVYPDNVGRLAALLGHTSLDTTRTYSLPSFR